MSDQVHENHREGRRHSENKRHRRPPVELPETPRGRRRNSRPRDERPESDQEPRRPPLPTKEERTRIRKVSFRTDVRVTGTPKRHSHPTEPDERVKREDTPIRHSHKTETEERVKGQEAPRRHSHPAEQDTRRHSHPAEPEERIEGQQGRRHSHRTEPEERVKGQEAPRRHSHPAEPEESVKGHEGHRRHSHPAEPEERVKGQEAPRRHSNPTEPEESVKGHEGHRRHSHPAEPEERDKGQEAPRRHSHPAEPEERVKDQEAPRRHSHPTEPDDRNKGQDAPRRHSHHPAEPEERVKGQEAPRRHSYRPENEEIYVQEAPRRHSYLAEPEERVQGQEAPRRHSYRPENEEMYVQEAPRRHSYQAEPEERVKGQEAPRRHSYRPDNEEMYVQEAPRRHSYPAEPEESVKGQHAPRRQSYPAEPEERVKGQDAPRRHSIPYEDPKEKPQSLQSRRPSPPFLFPVAKVEERTRKLSVHTEEISKDRERTRRPSFKTEEKDTRRLVPKVETPESSWSNSDTEDDDESEAYESRPKKHEKHKHQHKVTENPKIHTKFPPQPPESTENIGVTWSSTANVAQAPSVAPLDEESWNEKVLQVYDLIKEHKHAKAEKIHAARLAEFEMEQRQDTEPITPYWMIEVDRGPRNVEQLGIDFKADQNEKRRKRKELDDKYARPRFTKYGTSGLSFHSQATHHSGDLPPFVSTGLRFMNGLDKLFLEDEVYIKDAILTCNSEVRNTYTLLNAHGHKVYVLTEIFKDRFCSCCTRRSTQITAYDGDEVFVRMLFSSRCCLRYRRYVEIFSPSSNYLGKVIQKWKIKPYFQIRNYRNRLVATIKLMKRCPCGSTFKKVFKIRNRKREKIGEIRGNAKDLIPYLYSRHYMYGIFFSNELDVVTKTLIMGAAALVYKACYDGYLPKKKLTHDPTNRARAYYQYENYLANHPSYMSSEATLLNWQFPEKELIKIRA